MPEPQRDLPMSGDLDYVSPEEQSRRKAEEEFNKHMGQPGPPPTTKPPATKAPDPKQTTARPPAAAKQPAAGSKPVNEQSLLEQVIDNSTVEFKDYGTNEPITISFRDAYHFIAKPTKRGVKPPKRTVWLFMQFCKMRRLNPYTGDVFLVGYDSKDGAQFSQQVAHQALVKRAEANEHYDGKESGIVVQLKGERDLTYLTGTILPPESTLIGGWCKVYRTNRSHPEYQTTQLKSYKPSYEGNNHWGKDAEWMICKCAEAKALRGAFPNDLGGMYAEEEQFAGVEGVDETGDVQPTQGKGRLRRLPDPAPEPETSETLA